MKKVILSVVLGLLGLWIVGIILVNVFNVDLDKYFNGSGSPSTSAPSSNPADSASQTSALNWKTYNYSDFHFSIDSPIELKEMDKPKEITWKGIILDGKDMTQKFTVNVSAYDVQNYQPDFNKEMDQQIKIFKAMDSIMPNLEISYNPVTLSDAPGVLAEGTYQILKKSNWEMKLLKLKKGNILLESIVEYESTDENKAAFDKLIHSLVFKN